MGHKFDPRHAHKLEDPQRETWLPSSAVVGLLDLRGDETVVDYGAGTGVFTLALAEALPGGRVVAVDMSEELLAKLQAKLEGELRLRVDVVYTAANDVPLADGAADAVLAVNLLHEIYDEAPALAEIRRLLKPGGKFVVADWAAMERPAGPPADQVLDAAQARAVVTDMGLSVHIVHEPGELLAYHYALVAIAR